MHDPAHLWQIVRDPEEAPAADARLPAGVGSRHSAQPTATKGVGRGQEAAISEHRYMDPRGARIAQWEKSLPDLVHTDSIDLHWKLDELDGRFCRGHPKDGPMRTVATPPFLKNC